MMFAGGIVLVEKYRTEENQRIDEWRLDLQGKGLPISGNKIEYIKYEFEGRNKWSMERKEK